MRLPNAGAMDNAGEGKEKEECISTSDNSCEDWHLDQERALHTRVRVPGTMLRGPLMPPSTLLGRQAASPVRAGSRHPNF